MVLKLPSILGLYHHIVAIKQLHVQYVCCGNYMIKTIIQIQI